MAPERTEISAIGEFGLIDRIRKLTDFRVDDARLHERLVIGIGDDAAAYRPAADAVQLVTIDTFLEGVHFDLTYTSFSHLGWKAVAASLSDIAAMGGVPRYVLITLSIPAKVSVEMIEEFYSGAAFACKKYSCLIIGGDTAASPANLMVSSTVLGEAGTSGVIRRNGARVGDYICVTGHLGASMAGLKILQREKKRFLETRDPETFQPGLEPYKLAIEKHLMPKPRLDISGILAEHIEVHSMIDVSDGLASEVRHLCVEGNVGASVHEHNLPIDPLTGRIAAEFSDRSTDYALYGGEEYELLFTISDREYEKLERLTGDVSIIGRVTKPEDGITLVREQGQPEALPASGWDHFLK
jgi:thiamine-monophosphate kinase